jgi:hypothetical protein
VKLTAAMIAHEARTQGRSLRFRTVAVLYVLAGSAPAAAIYALRQRLEYTVGGNAYACEVASVLPALTAVLAFLLALDGITREQTEGAWSTVTLCDLSNAGYLLRRWIALVAVILPLTVLPFAAAAGFAAAHGVPLPTVSSLAAPWLLQVVPLTAAASALGLGLGTIGGGLAGTLPLLGFVLVLVPALLDAALRSLRILVPPPGAWFDVSSLSWCIFRMKSSLFSQERFGLMFPYPASESGLDLRVMGEQNLAAGTSLLAVAAASLTLAIVYLRRTRPDLRPRPVRPDHPLRSFLQSWSRMRERYKPDPKPAPADRLALAAGLLLSLGLLAVPLARAERYQGIAMRRLAAEEGKSALPGTPPAVLPGRWRVEGAIGSGRTIATRVSAELRNTGTTPVRRLGFQLRPGLAVRAEADARRLTLRRQWDRLSVELDPPLPPGGRIELRFRVSGVPEEAVFPLPFETGFQRAVHDHLQAKFTRDLMPFASAYEVQAVSPNRIDLQAMDLTPVPRYQGWAPDPEGRVPQETFFPSAGVELRLAGAAGPFLADSCGGVARPSGAGQEVLESRCRMPVSDLAVAGGPQRPMPSRRDAGTTIAILPAHAAAAEMHLGFLARGAGLLEEAWPGIGGLGRLVVVEWPSDLVFDRLGPVSSLRRYRNPYDSYLSVRGNLVLLQEMDLVWARQLEPEQLAAEIVSVRLARRRPLEPEHSILFRKLFRTIALQQLGLGPERGAVVGPLRGDLELEARVPPVEADSWSHSWELRFPALVAGLQGRMGAGALHAALDEFLKAGSAEASGRPATLDELFATLRRHSAAPIDDLIQEGFVQGKLASPTLDDVRFERAGDVWRATGKMTNLGDATAVCKVALASALGSEETELRAAPGSSARFELTSRQKPQAVVLDPHLECHRLVLRSGIRERVYFEENGR